MNNNKRLYVYVVSWRNTITGSRMKKVFFSLDDGNAYQHADNFLMEIVRRGRACHGEKGRYEPKPSISNYSCSANAFRHPQGANVELEPVYPAY